MDRRNFLKTSSAAAASLGALAAASGAAVAVPEAAREPVRLAMQVPWRARVGGFADDALRLARHIEARSGGGLIITLAYEVDGAVAFRGGAAMRIAPVANRVAQHAGFAYFAGLPGAAALDADGLDRWLQAGGGLELWQGLAAEQGFVPFLAGQCGAKPVLWSRRPITTVGDFEGLRVFARGLAAEVARGLGAEVVSVREQDAEALVTSGAVDAVEWGSLAHAHALGLPQRYPFGLQGALHRFGPTLALEIPSGVWRALGAPLRAEIAAATAAEFRGSVDEARLIDGAGLAAVQERSGGRIAAADGVLQEALDRVAATVVAHAAGRDRQAARIDQSYWQALAGSRSAAV